MSEKRKRVHVYHVWMECDECEDGVMNSTGVMFPTWPPRYPHECGKCGHKATYSKTYPCDVTELTNEPN